MKEKMSKKILKYIEKNKQVTAKELYDNFDISPRGIFKQLHNLAEKNQLAKTGKPPKVFYLIPEKKEKKIKFKLGPKSKKLIEDNFLAITPTGEEKAGVNGFAYWCEKRNLDIEKTAKEYEKTVNKFKKFSRAGLINGMAKMKATFRKVYIDQVYYLDFYSIERFGKTKLGQLLLYAKQSQNKSIIKRITGIIRPKITRLIKTKKIDAIAFIPPTIKREVQFMKEFERSLLVNLPRISILKIKTDIMVPQKTLNKLEDRVENAKKTIVVNERNKYNKVLLIDDAIGSGSTLNETAAQIKNRKISKSVIGLAITGSFKGFDVISEV